MPCASSHQQEVGGDSSARVILRDDSLGLIPVPPLFEILPRYNSNNNCKNRLAGVGGG